MMRQANNSRRSRGRGNGKKPPRGNHVDSHGPEVRVRGNIQQVYDKYLVLARDAASAGDRISAENYSQHAEHYFRLISAQENNEQNRDNRDGNQGRRQRGNNNSNNGPNHHQSSQPAVENTQEQAPAGGTPSATSDKETPVEAETEAEAEVISTRPPPVATPEEEVTNNASDSDGDSDGSSGSDDGIGTAAL